MRFRKVRGVDEEKEYRLVDSYDIDVSVKESITKDDAADTTCVELANKRHVSDARAREEHIPKLKETRDEKEEDGRSGCECRLDLELTR